MTVSSKGLSIMDSLGALCTRGVFWFLFALVAAVFFFNYGLEALFEAWQLPEYSHGPLIPVLSAFLFLRQLKSVPIQPGAIDDRWPGVALIAFSLVFGFLGLMSTIPDLVAYATILWIGGIVLVTFGWNTGKHFWPPVLHLVYMLPLPGVLYYKMSTWLQFVSSELGVWMLQMLSVPVFLEGNIIDLGVTKLHVAEACSGLRYLFPILSFSYIFAVLYRGPTWHKAVLLISAAPITVVMNSVRIAIAGYIVNNYGLGWVDGFTHFFEGWVIFIVCVLLLFLLARVMLFFAPEKMTLAEALDLEVEGLGAQFMRLQYIQPSSAMKATAMLTAACALAWQLTPTPGNHSVDRSSFNAFPSEVGSWTQIGAPDRLDPYVEEVLAATDYHGIKMISEQHDAPVDFFSAWYADQRRGGVHSPEICLPGNGWEIAWLERTDMSHLVESDYPFRINKAIIQKGETRMMVYYWFDQKGRKVAWDFAAKFWLAVDAIGSGRTDGALVRLTTFILPGETEESASARLDDMLLELQPVLPEFIPD